MRTAVFAASMLAFGLTLAAQGTKPREPKDYSVQAELGDLTLAAENFGHGISSEHGGLATPEFVSIEVAVFSKEKRTVELSNGHFTLRIDGRKTPLLAQPPGMVAAAAKYDNWGDRPRLTGTAGMGNGGIILGGPRQQPRFPGDPTGSSRIPPPPRVDTNNPNVPQAEELPIEEIAQRSALPEGPAVGAPAAGFLFFPFKGKIAKIKRLELLYSGPYGEAVLRLR